MNDGNTGYPWSQGDPLLAADLNAAIANSVALAGGMLPLNGSAPMTGPLTLSGNATSALHAVPLQQLNAATAGGPFLPISYTATGGTASRSAQDRAGSFLTVEDFGAKGDGTTDDSAAFNAYAAYIRGATSYQAQRTMVLSANRSYFIQHPIGLDNFGFNRVTVLGNGSNIISNVGATHTTISAMASSIAFKDLRITAQGPVLYGIQVGIVDASSLGDLPCRMDNVMIIGTFVNACLYNRAAEDSSFNDCRFQNDTATGGYAVIMDGCVHWQIDQTTINDALYVGTDQNVSFNEQLFINCILTNHSTTGPNSSAVWMGGGINRHEYICSYCNVGSASPAMVYYSANAIMAINHLVWDVHCEVAPTCIFFITGPYATPVIGELEYYDHYNQVAASGTVFKLDTSITSCTLRNLVYNVPAQQNNGVLLFDQPAKFTVTGNVAVPTRSVFNGAKFSGIISDAISVVPVATRPVTTQTLSANGQTIAVPFGYSGTEITNGTGSLTGLILAPGSAAGQEFSVFNASAFSMVFAAQTTSHVVYGGPVIGSYQTATFIWEANTAVWWTTDTAPSTIMNLQTLSASNQTITVPPHTTGTTITNGIGNLTGLIMAPGLAGGQRFTVLNASGFSLTFGAQAAANILTGGFVITTYQARTFIWDAVLALWWPT